MTSSPNVGDSVVLACRGVEGIGQRPAQSRCDVEDADAAAGADKERLEVESGSKSGYVCGTVFQRSYHDLPHFHGALLNGAEQEMENWCWHEE